MKLTKALILSCADKGSLDALWEATNSNCVECEQCKRCTSCERCISCEECTNSTDCVNCYNVDNSDNCTSCKHLGNAHNCSSCNGYRDDLKCRKLYQCQQCLNCTRCMFVVGATDAKNVVMGIQLTAAEFDQVWAVAGFG
jgi:hypothetical protein